MGKPQTGHTVNIKTTRSIGGKSEIMSIKLTSTPGGKRPNGNWIGKGTIQESGSEHGKEITGEIIS